MLAYQLIDNILFNFQMKTGFKLLFAPRFAKNWVLTIGAAFAWAYVGYRHKVSKDKQAYAMRGRSNLFRHEHDMLKKLDPTRELWY